MQYINAKQLKSIIRDETAEYFLLDVREENEFKYCHIAGSTLIPMQTIPTKNFNIGFTDLVKRPTAGCKGLNAADYRQGSARLNDLIDGINPLII